MKRQVAGGRPRVRFKAVRAASDGGGLGNRAPDSLLADAQLKSARCSLLRIHVHSSRAQQRRFDQFLRRYDEERPHEGINGDTPASRWAPSARPYPDRIVPPDYPTHMEVRRVSTAGTFRLHARQPFLSHALEGQDISLEEVADGIWNIVFYATLLGKIDERTRLITDV